MFTPLSVSQSTIGTRCRDKQACHSRLWQHQGPLEDGPRSGPGWAGFLHWTSCNTLMIPAKVFSFVAKSLTSFFPELFLEWLSSSACLRTFHCGLLRSQGRTNSFRQKDGGSQIKKIWYSHTCSSEEQITLLLLFWTLYQKRLLCKRMTSQPDANQRQTFLFFLSFNCTNSFICDRAY